MKEITIENHTFQYETLWSSSEYGDYPITYFYSGTIEKTYRKYLFFGKKMTKSVPKEVFRINADSEDTSLSKEWWRAKILNEISLLSREEEIKRGELI